MTTSQILIYYLLFATLFTFELIYSFYKKDDKYEVNGVIGNLAGYLVLKYVIRNIIVATIFGYFIILYQYLGNQNAKDGIISMLFCILIADFLYYAIHRLHHKIDFLWSFHHVHHSDTHFNLGVALRLSWAQAIYTPFLTHIPCLLLGFNVSTVLFALTLESMYQSFSHTSYIRLPRFLSYIFITPQNHMVHHDQGQERQTSNFGGIFSFWDRLFGTYVDKITEFKPGIQGYKQDNFFKMQTDPIISYIMSLVNYRSTKVNKSRQ